MFATHTTTPSPGLSFLGAKRQGLATALSALSDVLADVTESWEASAELSAIAQNWKGSVAKLRSLHGGDPEWAFVMPAPPGSGGLIVRTGAEDAERDKVWFDAHVDVIAHGILAGEVGTSPTPQSVGLNFKQKANGTLDVQLFVPAMPSTGRVRRISSQPRSVRVRMG